ncbi:hypothetical protein BT96DRAFT_511716 [Gymnopus androsaceus JB14]|uniref:Uncharacterized protein n=1 Tax=Gymnopus androsaceus JB14 TaxID=1447944 RepID=A0A6A4I0R6_9AGAR|nr:hypothetical protein BT96DRAFT_511716 [Gymnopus androsaceus JB14]
MSPVLLLVLIVFAILSLISLPYVSIRSKPLRFEDDREAWFTAMENKFPSKGRTSYAIQEGLQPSPDLQTAMTYRFDQYTRLAGHAEPNHEFVYVDSSLDWPWEEFKKDISRVSDAARDLAGASVYEISSYGIQQIQDDLSDVTERGISIPQIPLPPIELPSPEEILRRIREALEHAKKELDRVIGDESSQAEEVLRNIQRFVSVQIQLLPEKVRNAIQEFDKFRHEHPYIVAAASIALVILGTEVILPWMFLRVLAMFGFGELGPIAGSWAAVLQSLVYGGRTRGLFSILQRVTMSAKRFWPARVFLDLAAVAAGTIVVWSGEMIRDLVDMWYPEMVLDLNLAMQSDGAIVVDDWMQELGRRCEEAGIPEVQWFDVAIEAITRAVQEMAEASGV